MHFITQLGHSTLQLIARLGRFALLFLAILRACPKALRRWRFFIYQVYSLGILSLPVVLVAGLFVGMVLALQAYTNLVRFGAESALGALTALSLLRELAPVIAALLYAGRAGSALTAEIGLMKTTEQLASMEMMAVNPVEYVLAPRFMAGIFVMPILGLIFGAIGIIGGCMVSVAQLGVDSGSFWSQTQASVQFYYDVVQGVVIKSLVFGVVCNVIALFEGYSCLPTAHGISNATTKTVVESSLAVLMLDFLMTALMFT